MERAQRAIAPRIQLHCGAEAGKSSPGGSDTNTPTAKVIHNRTRAVRTAIGPPWTSITKTGIAKTGTAVHPIGGCISGTSNPRYVSIPQPMTANRSTISLRLAVTTPFLETSFSLTLETNSECSCVHGTFHPYPGTFWAF